MQHRLTNEELEQLPLTNFGGEIVVVETYDALTSSVEEMRREKILGFDTETRPSFTRGVSYGVALLQLSSPVKAWLIRINRVGLPQEVLDILQNKNITKIGAAIRDDIKALQKHSGFVPAGFVDLQDMAKEKGFEDFSLKKLAAHVMGVRISKRQRLSNWEAAQLSASQQSYAATDAWVSLKIYEGMQRGELEHERVREIIARNTENNNEI